MTPPAFIIARIAEVRGSSPREHGAYMLIAPQATLGSIGGGRLEHLVIAAARQWLADAICRFPRRRVHAYRNSASVAAGASASVTNTARTQAVGGTRNSMARKLSRLRCLVPGMSARRWPRSSPPSIAACIGWTTGRNSSPPPCPPTPASMWRPTPPTWCTNCPRRLVLVMTHDHALDLAICDAVLRRDRFRFLGLIGSQTKLAKFRKHLLDSGHSSEQLERITSPIGIPQIRSKQPERIALAAAAQLLAYRNRRTRMSSPPP
ncbi:MAG: XdhC family protein [Candidatus Thiothrix singaporensis]|uniref:XdhC family protein n=1 Tax=Candidatus Thiothrix singaporensis TaxID=2799669 RepID=A0A7L6AT72_9GAMM|nr:MAG: XdhC family protein [Candidatus Thiothrix singaporensis]